MATPISPEMAALLTNRAATANVLDIHELRQWASDQGYTHALTAAGPIPLLTWDPYGLEGVNHRPGDAYHGVPLSEGRVIDYPRDGQVPHPPIALGVWTLTTQEETNPTNPPHP